MLLLYSGYLFTDVLVPSSRVKISKNKLYFLTPQNGIDHFSRTSVTKYLPIQRTSSIVEENCALLSCYASCGNSLPTFRNYKLVPFSRVKSKKLGMIGCPETSVRNYHNTLRNRSEERGSHLRGGSLKSHKIL